MQAGNRVVKLVAVPAVAPLTATADFSTNLDTHQSLDPQQPTAQTFVSVSWV